MKFVVLGAGAIGGFLGARLARADEDVTLIARGAHLAAMRARGIRVRGPEGEFEAHPSCTDDMDVIRQADAVFLTVKAHAVTDIAPRLGSLLSKDAALVTAQNGVPWWYFQRYEGELEGVRLESVDPGGIIATSIDPQHIIGCVVYPATTLVEPGVIEHVEGNRFSIGELDGSRSERCGGIARALVHAGLKCPIRTQIRDELWVKLLGNAVLNPISALSRATLEDICREPVSRRLALDAMQEAEAVAVRLGAHLDVTVEQRLAGAEKVGAHKTSMLQDVEARRSLEIEALVGAVVEIAGLLQIPVPHLRTLYACAKLLDKASRQ